MKKRLLIFSLLICSLSNFAQQTGTFKDPRDGKVYKTIKIGSQIIMSENFAYKPSNGNYWPYENNPDNVATYGYLYDWDTAKSLAPLGWHLPTYEEWETLYSFLGENDKKVYDAIKQDGSFGFRALLAGYKDFDKFRSLGTGAYFWSASANGDRWSWNFYCYADNANLACNDPRCGLSVRLFKD